MYSAFMPARRLTLDAIRAELAWVNETPDPNKRGCRNVRCCEETGHKSRDVPDQSQRSFGRFGGSILPTVS